MTSVAVFGDDEKNELSIIEQVVMQGDLSKLNPNQRVFYYKKVCESLGLNPYTRPFDYIILNGKMTLYVKREATEQLRKLHGISIEKLESKLVDDLYIVTATARDKTGRTDESTGAVSIGHLKGEARANAIMKAETKAKRRVTLSISGLGWTDESEVDSIPNAKKVDVDMETGELINVQGEVVHDTKKIDDPLVCHDLRSKIKQLQGKLSDDKNLSYLNYLTLNNLDESLMTASNEQLNTIISKLNVTLGEHAA